MGRPREFRDDDVLDRATDLFWRRGYGTTSVRDLVEATGLSRASLYGAFGGKEGLLTRALDRYRDRFDDAARVLEEAPSVREGLRRFFDLWLETACPVAGPRGCFLTQTATESEEHPRFVERMVREQATRTEEALIKALRRGKRTGELSTRLDERATARFLAVFLQGIGTAARAGRTRRELQPAVARALRAVG